MKMRTVGAWAGFVLSAMGLTGCAGSGANSNFRQPATPATTRINPPAATPTATAGASTATTAPWNQKPQAATPSTGDPSALAAPTGNAPQFNVQPTGGITPAAGIAPPTAPVAPPAMPGGTNTSSLMPTGASINSLTVGTPVSVAPAPSKQVAVNAVRTADPPRPAKPVPAAPVVDDTATPPPPMPAAPVVAEPTPSAQVTNSLSPVTLQTPPPPPTKVRQ
jgi:hypothetical protein